tara:strand:- start:79 stop:1356 length:1278 start_codon:yes stop_codon:yes gene_type:complete
MFKWIIKLIPKFIKTWFINLLYDDIASKGINGDTELAYLTQQQQNFLKSIGGSGTLNPHTGCKQYFGPLAIGLMVGTAAFGIAKLAGLSTKKALGIGLLGGLGAGGIKALMAAPTSTAMSTGVSQLGAAAGSGSTAAAEAAAALQAGSASGMGVGSALPSAFPSAASITAGAPAIPSVVSGAVPTGISSAFPSGASIAAGGSTIAPIAQGATMTPTLASQLGEGASAVGQYIKENPLTTIGGGATLLSLASQPKTPAYGTTAEGPFSEEEYRQAYERQRARVEPLSERAEYERDPDSLTPKNIYDRQEMMYANKGGLSSFREGGVNYLPSKSDHDEKDSNNYVRATGYVEDGSGNGDKDEDTMLAQLADGEFVSRADAVLGAGIMQGANPEDFKDMRRKGAQFFYKQQDQFKRIYDIVNDGNKTS